MAKATTKTSAMKKSAKPASSKIEKVSGTIVEKLASLNLEPQLQADLRWCLGSYGYDKNPSGLYENVSKALVVFKGELEKKTKGVTKKLISDIEKALAEK